MKQNLLTSILCLGIGCAMAQEQNIHADERAKLERLKGTFSIITNHRFYELPHNLSDLIEKNRLADKENVINVANGVSVVIYPLQKVKVQETDKK